MEGHEDKQSTHLFLEKDCGISKAHHSDVALLLHFIILDESIQKTLQNTDGNCEMTHNRKNLYSNCLHFMMRNER